MTEKPRRAETATSNWNVPNVLTVIRIILVPVYVALLFTARSGSSSRSASSPRLRRCASHGVLSRPSSRAVCERVSSSKVK